MVEKSLKIIVKNSGNLLISGGDPDRLVGAVSPVSLPTTVHSKKEDIKVMELQVLYLTHKCGRLW